MQPGTLVDGRFIIEALAGAGGMGEVFKAHDGVDGGLCALKVQARGASRGDRARFAQEASTLAGLRHPGIVRYVAHGEADGRPWIAMEWLEGEDLGRRLVRGPLDVAEALALGERVADALGAAHAQGICVHRDLKPDNLFLVGGAIDAVKIIDFGIARIRSAARATQTGVVIGTPGYMAPEQARGTKQLDARADVFALGAILYECLAGAPVFQALDVMALLVKILVEHSPRPLGEPLPRRACRPRSSTWVARMLAKDPRDRPATAAAVAEALGAAPARRPRPRPRRGARGAHAGRAAHPRRPTSTPRRPRGRRSAALAGTLESDPRR